MRSPAVITSLKLASIVLLVVFVGAISFGKLPGLPGPANEWLGKLEVSKGLDLSGGLHLEYSMDLSGVEDDARQDALDAVQAVIERRVNAFGVGEPVVQIATRGSENFLIVELPGIKDIEQAKDLIKETPFLEFREERTQEGREEFSATLDETVIAEAQAALTRIQDGEDFYVVQNEINPQPEITAEDQDATASEGETESEDAQENADENADEKELTIPEDNYVRSDSLIGAPEISAALFESDTPEGSVHPEVVESPVGYHILRKGASREVTVESLAPESEEDATTETDAEADTETDAETDTETDTGTASGDAQEGETQDEESTESAEGEIITTTETEVGYQLITFSKPSAFAGDDLIYKPTDLTGEFLKKAEVTYPSQGVSRPQVSIFFNSEGGEMFAELTKRSVGKTIAIAVDDAIVSAPSVSQQIFGNEAQITGNFTNDEAQELAGRLNEGALPVPISLVAQQSIEASLGAQALAVSLTAGAWGLILIMIYMIAYYRLFGLIAAGAIAFYTGAIVTILKLTSQLPAGLSITLTLAGIAGLILSIGMAVDANILIFERIKEELKRGRRLHHAIDEGFARAWSAIRDGNSSTIITCLILMMIGTGFVKGFALILILGVIVSIFTAVVLVRIIIRMSAAAWLEDRPWLIARGLGKSTASDQDKKSTLSILLRYDFIGNKKYTYIFSAVLIVISIGAVSSFGLRLGIDFTGGTRLEIRESQPNLLTRDSMCAELPSEVCTGSFAVRGTDSESVIIEYRKSEERTNQLVTQRIAQLDPESETLQTDFTGATISDQLKDNTITAIILAIAAILIYIGIVFRNISFPVSSWSYGASAVIALVHDVIIVIGSFAILGHYMDAEVGVPFVAALLTILGYSVNDTIVVYDRVRENILRTKNTKDFVGLLNTSIRETFARSMNTSMTVVVVLVAMLIWGSASLQWFLLALLIGVVAGTYSSIFVATAAVASMYEYKKSKKLL